MLSNQLHVGCLSYSLGYIVHDIFSKHYQVLIPPNPRIIKMINTTRLSQYHDGRRWSGPNFSRYCWRVNAQNRRHWDHLRWLQTNWKNWELLLFSSYPCARFLKDQWSSPRVSAIDMVGNSFCFRPGVVIPLSSEPRTLNEKVKSCKLIVAWYQSHVCSRSCSLWNKQKTNNFYILWGLSDISAYQQNLAWLGSSGICADLGISWWWNNNQHSSCFLVLF